MALAREDSEFLSEARCRHFLAAIASRLLHEVSQAADPDRALTNLEKVSASLGAKAVLWELFSVNPPSLRLYVKLCATSQFLSEILINNPGMIDDLMDSLVVDRAQPATAIREELAELCKGAEDPVPILLAFRNKEWVRVGARDILGREPIRVVTRELSDVAEAIVQQVAADQYARLAARFGEPRREGTPRPARWAIVALGKFGGRELNYHSDLDLVCLYESDGSTKGGTASATDNLEFFTELARRVLRTLGGACGAAMLYRVDLRLRPHGTSGPLVMKLDRFRDYYDRQAAPWERLALTRARVCHARGDFGRRVAEAIREALSRPVDPARLAADVLAVRHQLEKSCGPGDVKRGRGGQVDIEFLVQYLQLAHGPAEPSLLRPNIWEALEALRRARRIDREMHDELRGAYDLLRTVESRIRIVHSGSVVGSLADPQVLSGVAGRMEGVAPDESRLAEILACQADRVRSRFLAVVGAAATGS
jgi:glutamate-ammonia-ligase adenylyltransferase